MQTKKPTRYPVYVVQGAQWGSEGKGQIAAVLADHHHCGAVVRTGSINAGHTVFYQGREHKMQLLPTSWVHPEINLVLGPGCFIHRGLLEREIRLIAQATGKSIRHVVDRILIDYRCTIHSLEAETRGANSPRHHEMGATGKGSSEAVIDRLNARGHLVDADRLLFREMPWAGDINLSGTIVDTTSYLFDALNHQPILLEGTQGAHLDLFTGPWPYTSNRPCSVAAWLAYAGISTDEDIRPVLVARTFPIRVAGNSGPMPGETTWPALYRGLPREGKQPFIHDENFKCYEDQLALALAKLGCPLTYDVSQWTDAERREYKVALSEAPSLAFAACSEEQRVSLAKFMEMTTVTRKIRRVADWDLNTVAEAIKWNGCHQLWFSFLNYKFPQIWGSNSEESMTAEGWNWMTEQQTHLAYLLGRSITLGGYTTERLPQNHIHLA